jgi:hypothetical protein
MSTHRESPGHSERPDSPATRSRCAARAAPSASDLLTTPAPASALPAVVGTAAPGEAGEPGTSLTPHIDAHGFDPAEYKWIPVRRRPRKDGWSEARQRLFIEALADSGCVQTAATAVQMSVQSAYGLRRAPGGEAFAAAWTAALQQGALKLADVAFERALLGTQEPVFDRAGIAIGCKTRYSERLMMFLLRAHLPERYAHAHRTQPPADAPSLPQTPPLAEAIARLEPALPPEPHALMPPEELDVELECADILQGELPQRYGPLPPEAPSDPMPLGEEFERRLEAAKQGCTIGPNGEMVADPPGGKQRANSRSRPKLP